MACLTSVAFLETIVTPMYSSIPVSYTHLDVYKRQILDIEVFLYAAEILFDAAKQFKELDFLDFGSGFKVPYKKGDIETNIEELGQKLTKRFLAFEKEYGRTLTLAFEPGKFLVSEAGFFLAKVNVVKQTTSTVFAGIDSGFCLLYTSRCV